MCKQIIFKRLAALLCCMLLLGVVLMSEGKKSMAGNLDEKNARSDKSDDQNKATFVVWGVRYQVKEVERSINFYVQHLGFKLEQKSGTAFASVSNGELKLLLSGPGSSGSRALPNGQRQEPGGWNRVVLKVDNLESVIATLKKAGLHFRNEMESGPGGKQIQVEDPDGNPVELFEPGSPQSQ